jgi:hypothetical protein
MPGIVFTRTLPLRTRSVRVALHLRTLPPLAAAEARAHEARTRFASLRAAQAPRTAVRTAECDWFGAEETVALARAATDGRLEAAAHGCTPAEIQLIELGSWQFVLWPGEFFVEYALEVKAGRPSTFVITLANGELQGYIATPEAAACGAYEATNALFGPENGRRMVEATLALLATEE